MKTAELIETLAADAGRPAVGRPWRRLSLAGAAGAAAALLLMLFALQWTPLPGIETQPWFWMKLGYAGAMAAAASLLAIRLSRPGARPKLAVHALPALLAAMLLVGALQTLPMAPEQRLTAWRGATWTVCSWRILLLSLPIGLCLMTAMRTLAPTRLAAAGAAAGVLAGSLAAGLYALHCPEHGAGFVAVWYSLGVAAAGAVGAIAGRFVLRW